MHTIYALGLNQQQNVEKKNYNENEIIYLFLLPMYLIENRLIYVSMIISNIKDAKFYISKFLFAELILRRA